MKKFLKYLLFTLAGLVGVILLVVSIVALKPQATYPVQAPDLKVELSPTRVNQGQQISSVYCKFCHQSETGRLEGQVIDLGGSLGDLYSANITQDKVYGIGEYTDGELFFLFKTGIKRDGHMVLPMMNQFPHMADEDLYSLIAYLRSDAPEVQASQKFQPAYEPNFLGKALFTLAFKPLEYVPPGIVAPDTSNLVEYGRYLVNNRYMCYDCHSGSFETNNTLAPEKSGRYLKGGNVLATAFIEDTLITPNITMDPDSGLGQWSEAEFAQTVRTGRRPDGQQLRFPMSAYSFLDSLELAALYAYLQTVPHEEQIAED